MATYSAVTVVNKTLAADTVDTVNLSQPATHLLVANLDHSGTTIYFTFADATKGTLNPTVAGDNCYAVSHGPHGVISLPMSGVPIQVKLISGGIQRYSVMVI